MSEINPWRIIEGKYPQYKDMEQFTEHRWMSLLQYFSFFIISYENSEKWSCTSKAIEGMESFLNIDNHPYHEFIWRVGQWKGKTTSKKFQFKINGMAMHCLVWLKKHPGAVTQDMKILIESHPQRMRWCLEQFKTKETLNGGEIVVRDNTVQEMVTTRQTSLPSVQATVMTAIVKVADIVKTLADGISSTELKALDTDEKLKHIARLVPILTNLNKKASVNNHLTQINLNGNVDDLEKDMLTYVQKTQE